MKIANSNSHGKTDTLAYLRELWPDPPVVHHAYLFSLPGEKSHWFKADDLEGMADRAISLSATADVYLGMGLAARANVGRRARREEVSAIACLWCDLDVAGDAHKGDHYPPTFEDARALANEAPLPPSLFVHS